MTNGEKYKSVKERTEAFEAFCDSHGSRCDGCPLIKACDDGSQTFAWLELEAEKEKPLPCPFCGNPTYVDTIVGFKNVSCSYCGMKSPTHKHTNEAEAIAEFNCVARAVMAAKDKEAK